MMKLSSFTDSVTLEYARTTNDEFGHKNVSNYTNVVTLDARVEQMSASKSMMVYQQADIVGVDIWFLNPEQEFNTMTWRDAQGTQHRIHFSQPEFADRWGKVLHITGYYQIDNPL